MANNGLVIPVTDSTQEEMKKRLSENEDLTDFYFVQAIRQTEGRGRNQREWVSPEGNLFLSVLLRGPHPSVTWIPHRVALAVVRALLNLGVPASRLQIKWPNDILVDGKRKLAGILCEKIGNHVVAGLGVNVAVAPEVPEKLTTSVKELLGGGFSTTDLRDELLHELKRSSSDMRTLRIEYVQWLSFQRGQAVSWRDEATGSGWVGKFIEIGEYGEMKVETPSGVKSLFSEEVHLSAKES